MRKSIKFALALLIALVLINPAVLVVSAESAVIQLSDSFKGVTAVNGINPDIDGAAGNIINGGNNVMFIASSFPDADWFNYGILRFDFAAFGIPADAVIDSAVLKLYSNRSVNWYLEDSMPGNVNVGFYRILDPDNSGFWVRVDDNLENPLDYDFKNNTVNPPVPWKTGGNFLDACAKNLSFAKTVKTDVHEVWVDFASDGLLADIQAWVDGSAPNLGWMMKVENVGSGVFGFNSPIFLDDENYNITDTPKLELTYHIKEVAAEPEIAEKAPAEIPAEVPVATPAPPPPAAPKTGDTGAVMLAILACAVISGAVMFSKKTKTVK